jgi:hypothetical protein
MQTQRAGDVQHGPRGAVGQQFQDVEPALKGLQAQPGRAGPG